MIINSLSHTSVLEELMNTPNTAFYNHTSFKV